MIIVCFIPFTYRGNIINSIANFSSFIYKGNCISIIHYTRNIFIKYISSHKTFRYRQPNNV